MSESATTTLVPTLDGSKRKRCDLRSLKPEQWPAAFQTALSEACRAGKPSAPGGLAASWRSASLRMRLNGFGLHLSWQIRVGLLKADSGPGDGVTPDSVDAWIDYLLQSGNGYTTVATRLDQLFSMLRALAPTGDWTFILAAHDWFVDKAKGHSTKLARIVHPADLYQLGCELRQEAQTTDGMPPRLSAVTYRDGLMISMLAAAPIRRGNFTVIEIGQHLVRREEGYWLGFESSETKGKRPSRKPLPPDLSPAIEQYLNFHRRHLCERAELLGHHAMTTRLWLSDEGTPLSEGGIYQIIVHRTKARFGFVVNPHLFRHCAQTAWAIDDPATSQGGKVLLDHGSFRTTTESYELGTGLADVERFQQKLIARRDRGLS